MQSTQTKGGKAGRMARRDQSMIRTTKPSTKTTNRLVLPRPTRITPLDYIDATLGNKSGFATYDLSIGDVTYRAILWGIKSTVAIADVTVNIGGVHYVRAELISNYIGEVRYVANGTAMQTYDMAELYSRNTLRLQDNGPVYSGFLFPGENLYRERRAEDAFALGTSDLRSLTLELKLKDTFDADTMTVDLVPHAVDVAKPVSFTFSNERLNRTFSGSGKHTYKDIPVADDIMDIWVQGDGITHLKMTVDKEVIFNMNRAQYESYLITNGRDPSVLNGQWFLDFHAEGEPRSIAALDQAGERKRNANITFELTTSNPETPVEFIVTNADLFKRIR